MHEEEEELDPAEAAANWRVWMQIEDELDAILPWEHEKAIDTALAGAPAHWRTPGCGCRYYRRSTTLLVCVCGHGFDHHEAMRRCWHRLERETR